MSRRAGHLAAASHPGPTAVVTLLTTMLGLAIGLGAGRLALLTVAVLLGQLSIGLSNDAIDAGRDAAVGRQDKPIARGAVSVATVWIAAGVALAGAVAVSFWIGPLMGVLHTAGIAGGWAYNLGLKRTAFSVLPFLTSFGLLPSFATASAEPAGVAAVWAGSTGAVLGLAIHLTNTLPDLDDDERTGVHGLPHRLGPRVSALLAYGGLAVGSVIALVGSDALGRGGAAAAIAVVGFVATVMIAATGTVLSLRRPPSRLGFQLVMAAGLLLAAQLALSGAQLAG